MSVTYGDRLLFILRDTAENLVQDLRNRHSVPLKLKPNVKTNLGDCPSADHPSVVVSAYATLTYAPDPQAEDSGVLDFHDDKAFEQLKRMAELLMPNRIYDINILISEAYLRDVDLLGESFRLDTNFWILITFSMRLPKDIIQLLVNGTDRVAQIRSANEEGSNGYVLKKK